MNSRLQSSFVPLCGLALVLALGGCNKSKSSSGSGAGAPTLATTVSNKLAAIAATGAPITLEELNKSYVEPPAGENVAPLYEQAFNAVTGENTNAASFLAHNQKAVSFLLQVPDRKACRYPFALTGVSTLLPHLSNFKKCAWLLQEEAISQAARGRTDAATKAMLAGLRLARSLDNEPMLISKLVELATLMITLDGLGQALTRRAFSDDQLISLQFALKETEPLASLRRAMIGERAVAIANFQASDERLAEYAKMMVDFGAAEKSLDLVAYRKKPIFLEDFAFALDYLSNLVTLAGMPYEQSLSPAALEMIPDIETVNARGYLMSGMSLSLAKAITRGAAATAKIRATQTVLAVERYRLKHANALPASLAELTPELLASVPLDPFDNQPLRYHKMSGKGYVVYSVGRDGKDDGGSVKSPDGKLPQDVGTVVGR